MNYAINLCEQWGHAMDIGGDSGHYAAGLATKFKAVTLVEVSELPEHRTLATHVTNITIFRSLIEKYTSEKKADFILLADVFEHIPDIKTFIDQLATLQPIGGVVYIMTPNPLYCGPAPESGTYHTRHPYGHIKHYTVSEINELMGAAGYRLEFLRYEEAPLRQVLKRIVFGLARRDTTWNNYFAYRMVRPLLAPVLHTFLWCISVLADRSEKKHQNNPLNTITHSLAFKKTRTGGAQITNTANTAVTFSVAP